MFRRRSLVEILYSGNNFSLPQQNFAQPAIQPAAPAPSYTQPSVVQPEQNRRLR